MKDYLLEMLLCPVCHGALKWNVSGREGEHIQEGEAHCLSCGTTYPVHDGIPVFLTPDLSRTDLWEQAESGLSRALRASRELEQALMNVPVDTLNPADQFFRAMVLEERGRFEETRLLSEAAFRRLYTEEYLRCWQSQTEYVVAELEGKDVPIVDLASGRGALAKVLAERLTAPLILTDFSPTVLRRTRRMFETLGRDGNIDLLAFDARRTPFHDRSVLYMTSNLGLPNVEHPGELLRELRRIVAGDFLAISHFYPEDDAANLSEVGDPSFFVRKLTVQRFHEANWSVAVENVCESKADPTPRSNVFQGAVIDRMPVSPTRLEWCVLVAR